MEETAGVSANRIAYAHGSLKFATCESCRSKVPASAFEDDILAGRVARCQSPRSLPTPQSRTSTRKRQRPFVASNVCGGVLKPGVTFFGEALHDTVKTKLEADRDKVDALIVIGTSLSVYVLLFSMTDASHLIVLVLPFPKLLNIFQNRSHGSSSTGILHIPRILPPMTLTIFDSITPLMRTCWEIAITLRAPWRMHYFTITNRWKSLLVIFSLL